MIAATIHLYLQTEAFSATRLAEQEPAPLGSELMAQDWQDRVYVKASTIQGLGVFARRTFATGETILVREERPVTTDQPLDAGTELASHCDWLEGGRQVYLGFPERHFNHSCDANAFVRFKGGVATVVSLRPIRPNEEITNNYSLNLWGGDAWVCNCGSERCTHDVPGSFFGLPLERQIELSPLLAAWFILEHQDEYNEFLRRAGLEDATGI
ncbi:MAG TPA: SET domain-containing protein-lysine N-methyltransferase [Dehalococcoidia bacterium]|nr:SET domain-containing protein-lysine N-methyltransferase [Dehalococcoidia bacterium]